MSKFDETKPYSCTYGMGGIQGYEQNGLQYNARKKLISDVPAPIADAVPDAPVADSSTAQADAVVPDYASMHWSALKKLVAEKGGEWIDKTAAITFLTGN